IKSMGRPEHLYISADASDIKALQKAYEEIKRKYSKIDGVIHSAIVLSDKSLMNMEEEQFRASLSAKVDVSVCMAQVFAKEPLDFMLFFSSIQSFMKAAGQGNYAAGCTFKDAFAHRLSCDTDYPVKVINWGYWGSVGIVASKEYNDQMAGLGIGSVEPEEGMDALEKLLAAPVNRLAFMKTTESFDWQGINTGESVALCPQNVSLNMKNILGSVLNRDIKEIRESADFATELNELLFRMMQGQLQAVGLFAEKRQRTETIKRKTGIIHLYDRWLEQSLAVFSKKGLIEYDGESYTARDISPADTDALWKEWERKKNAWSENPGMRARAELVEATLYS
ncbi:MAG: SDR family NAD(P)-dependent oxidoreductase, partial [bacterium]|nr:SDR family NAD(P)-dependent oxidoreductase [bacterium]